MSGSSGTSAAPLRTLIVDDEAMAVERLQLLLCDDQRVQCVGTANDGESALRLIEALRPDLVLLDISMPGLTGLDVAQTVAAAHPRPAVVFVTAYDQHAVQAFDLEAADYLLKPVERGRLLKAVERVWSSRDGDNAAEGSSAGVQEFWVGHRGEMIRVAARDIERIEAERDYMRLHTGEQSYLLHTTMAALEEKLDPDEFVRIHRSHIFRKGCIQKLVHDGLGAWFAEDPHGNRIRIGRTYVKSVKAIVTGG